ncbi:MAG: hypothetical protein COA42_16975, partial [Alteromonadaceae bacterium]
IRKAMNNLFRILLVLAITLTTGWLNDVYAMPAGGGGGGGNSNAGSGSGSTSSGAQAASINAIDSLIAREGVTGNQVNLQWVAPVNNATAYEIRQSTAIITADNWLQASPVVNSISPGRVGAAQSLSVDNIPQQVPTFFAIRTLGSANQLSPVSNSAVITLPIWSDTTITPFVLNLAQVERNQVRTQTLQLDNLGDEVLNYQLTLTPTGVDTESTFEGSQAKAGNNLKNITTKIPFQNIAKGQSDPRKGNIVTQGFGGPDESGYRWIDSNELGGPNFEWQDISETGMLINDIFDDSVSGPLPIGFEFEFYDQTFSDFYLSSNGFISFDSSFDSGCCSGQPMGVADRLNNVIAWMWYDMHPRGGSVYYQTIGNQLIIQFSQFGEFFGSGKVDAEIILSRSGKILLQYKSFSNSMEDRQYSIGVENGDGSDGLQVAFNTPYLEENLAIEISQGSTVQWLTASRFEGRVLPGGTESIDLEYKATLASGTYTASLDFLNIDTNSNITLPVSIEISDDSTGPNTVSDLSASDVSFNTLELQWPAPSDVGLSRAVASYEIRYSNTPLTEANWGGSSLIAPPEPRLPAQLQVALVEGLVSETNYYFALKSTDTLGNVSPISNIVSVLTTEAPSGEVSSSVLTFDVVEGEQSLSTLSIQNTGNVPLFYQIDAVEPLIGNRVASSKPAYINRATTLKRPLINHLPAKGSYNEGELIVRFKDGIGRAAKSSSLARHKATVIQKIPALNLEVWQLRDDSYLLSTMELLDAMPEVAYVELNRRLHHYALPDDERLEDLWGLHNTGSTGGTAGADIDALEAWGLETGDRSVIVAVVDTGIDYTHPDLADNMWINTGEIADNGIDDDGNGFVDDIYGYDFINNDGDPMDDGDHGTHVAGTVGAVGNNNIGVSGVNHEVSLMAIKFLGAFGGGDGADAAAGIIYATDNGAHILNNSWGGGPFSQTLLDAIEYAHDHDVLFVAAAGNSGIDNDTFDTFPANYEVPNVISVAATDHNDALAGFSQFGLNSVDLGAPGVDVVSTVPGDNYVSFDGTSMASPHVAGVAALLKAYRPAINSVEIKAALLESVDPINDLQGRSVSGGRLNALSALNTVFAPWLNLDGALVGEIPAGETLELSVQINSTDLEPGNYQVNLTVDTNELGSSTIVLPVMLSVAADTTAPNAVTDLRLGTFDDSTLVVNFSAPGDDGAQGQVGAYDLRYSQTPITAETWFQATRVSTSGRLLSAGQTESLQIDGLTPRTSYWVALRSDDNVGNTSSLSNLLQVTTLAAQLRLTPNRIPDITIASNQQQSIPLTFANTGSAILKVNIDLSDLQEPELSAEGKTRSKPQFVPFLAKGELNTLSGQVVEQGFGSDNTFGYNWIDSNEPGGPVFNWIDISETGTLIDNLADDAYLGPFDIGFDFSFYGLLYDEFYFSTNGQIGFSPNQSSACCSGRPIPGDFSPNNFIAWLWNDLHPQLGQVYYQYVDDKLIVQMNKYGEFGGAGSVDAQIILQTNGRILLQYGEFLNGMEKEFVSVGIENFDGSDGLQIAYNTPYLEGGLAVLISDSRHLLMERLNFSIAPGEEQIHNLEIDTTDLAPGLYVGSIMVTSNDPDTREITHTIQVRVTAP